MASEAERLLVNLVTAELLCWIKGAVVQKPMSSRRPSNAQPAHEMPGRSVDQQHLPAGLA